MALNRDSMVFRSDKLKPATQIPLPLGPLVGVKEEDSFVEEEKKEEALPDDI